jgi:hypothetical protein
VQEAARRDLLRHRGPDDTGLGHPPGLPPAAVAAVARGEREEPLTERAGDGSRPPEAGGALRPVECRPERRERGGSPGPSRPSPRGSRPRLSSLAVHSGHRPTRGVTPLGPAPAGMHPGYRLDGVTSVGDVSRVVFAGQHPGKARWRPRSLRRLPLLRDGPPTPRPLALGRHSRAQDRASTSLPGASTAQDRSAPARFRARGATTRMDAAPETRQYPRDRS